MSVWTDEEKNPAEGEVWLRAACARATLVIQGQNLATRPFECVKFADDIVEAYRQRFNV